jgi:predicted MPP superfamily phosphohydrolase
MAVNWLFAFVMVTGIPLCIPDRKYDRRIIAISSLIFCSLFLISNKIWKFLVETRNQTPLEIVRKINDVKLCTKHLS